MKTHFEHEKLHVYQELLALIRWVTQILEKPPKSVQVSSQLDRASTSPPVNIARRL